jgi:hypothetical protein
MRTKSFFTKMLDSRDRQIEAHLVLLCVGAATMIALSIYHVVILKLAFDADSFGQGVGFLLAGGGAAAWGQGLQRSNERTKDDAPYQ